MCMKDKYNNKYICIIYVLSKTLILFPEFLKSLEKSCNSNDRIII